MKQIKKILSLIAVLALLLTLLPAAFADGEEDARFRDKTWEEVVRAFLEENGVDADRLGCGYYNTVSGEEHYINPDQYMVTCSMYKVPLNMIYTERIYNGEMDWDTSVCGYRYETALEESIINSNNDLSVRMSYSLGGGNWREFRKLLAPYMGADPDTVEEKFFENNFSTPRQTIACLKLLYENPERFPRLIDTMLRAEPNRFFNQHPQAFPIAHKYGYLAEDWHLYLNDCAICYTDDPICIVLYTDSIGKDAGFLADFCTLMCDYAQYWRPIRLAAEQKAAEEAAIAALNQTAGSDQSAAGGDKAATPGISQMGGAVLSAAGERSGERFSLASILRAAAAVVLVIVGFFAVGWAIVAVREKKARGFWAILAAVLTVLALLVCVTAPALGAALTVAEGDPQETVDQFFSTLLLGNYEKAYACLNTYRSLGLENIPATEAGGKVYAALRQSYSYKLYGDCEIDGLTARQPVIFTYLDLTAIRRDLKAAADARLENMAQTMSRGELYDGNGDLRPGIADRAYAEAVDVLLSRPADYTVTTALVLSLSYGDNGWHIDADNTLLDAVSGGAAYGKGGDLS